MPEERRELMDGYVYPEALIETGELEGRLEDPTLAVVEVDEDATAYDRGHLPGAVAINWQTELHDVPRREFVSSDQLAALLGRKGISSEQTIVLYGGNNNWFAAYAYWLFNYRGVEKVKLLNGGRKKWELEGRTMVQDVPESSPATFQIGPERPELRAFREEVLDRVRSGSGTFVDVRSPEEFRGELLAPPHLPQEQAQVPGHIPAARNVPWLKAARDDGSFKSAAELQELYSSEGVAPEADVIAYCRIGERSAHTWFVLSALLGYPNVKNYDGSWTEYGSLVGVAVER